MWRTIRHLIKDDGGGPAVEMVLATPMIIILIVGITQIGQAIHYHQVLSDGTRAAIRYLSRVQDPCLELEQQRAVSLVVTRSLDWSTAPVFDEWPADFAGVESDERFQMIFGGCDETGALAGEVITLDARYRFTDDVGVLRFIGLEGGFWTGGRHQERFIGI